MLLGGSFVELKAAYDAIKQGRKIRICEIHFIEAGQRLTAELTSFGMILMRLEDGRTYVHSSDVHPQIVTNLQDILCDFDDSFLFTEADIQTFVNDCLFRYYNGEEWRGPDLRFPKRVQHKELEGVKEAADPSGFQIVPPGTPPSTLKEPKPELRSAEKQQSPSNSSYIRFLPSGTITVGSPNNEDTSGSSSDPFWDVHELASQDNNLLKKYFIVKGEQLLQLFQFCPQCGSKIPKGNTVRLLQHGTAPVVEFLCKECSLQGEPVKRWEGQC
ncbi:hypothetical protein RB195_004736 [Necator americanus]